MFQLIHYLSDKEAIDAAALAVAASPPGVYPLQLPLVGGRSNEMVEIEGLEPISTSAAVGQWHNSIEVNSTPHHHGTSSSLSGIHLYVLVPSNHSAKEPPSLYRSHNSSLMYV